MDIWIIGSGFPGFAKHLCTLWIIVCFAARKHVACADVFGVGCVGDEVLGQEVPLGS